MAYPVTIGTLTLDLDQAVLETIKGPAIVVYAQNHAFGPYGEGSQIYQALRQWMDSRADVLFAMTHPARQFAHYLSKLPEGQEIHWLVVGYVSPEATREIQRVGGLVAEINQTPRLVVVALPYASKGYWSWSHGRQQHRSGIEFWNTGEIQMEHLTLEWPRDSQWQSVAETYLILPDEEWDEKERCVKAPEPELVASAAGPAKTPSDDFDPFLDSDDLP